MIVSTRGRYALRVMIDLAEHRNEGYIPLKEISERQEISLKYLEGITSSLSKAGLVTGVSGKGGGYALAVDPTVCTAKSVLFATGEKLSSVTCLASDTNDCPRAAKCKTLPMWKKLNGVIDDFFGNITIEDLANDNR